MSSARRLLRHPALWIVLFSVPLIRPILTPANPCTDDLSFHILRLVQLDRLLRDGVLYSRWAPDMGLGYGLPFFNFYAPLSYYLAFVPGLALGAAWGVKVTLALSVVGAGGALYRLARDYFRPIAALTAAVAYMTAPYLAYDIYFRGNLAESVAWALLPPALWTMRRLARSGGRRWLGLTALTYAAVLLTHNVFALIFSPLLALVGLVEWWGVAQGRGRRLAAWSAALALGLALAAFFWLPAMLERPLVYSDRLLVPPVFVYWNNFISAAELLAVPRLVRPDLINPSPERGLGLVTAAAALPALLGIGRLRPTQRRGVLLFAAATVVYGLAMLPVAEPVWDALPLVEFIQFPWRLLGPAALCLALVVGGSAEWLAARTRSHFPLLLALMAGLVVADLAWLAPPRCPGLTDPAVADIVAYELATDTLGTTAKGEYVPRTVAEFPQQPASGPLRSGDGVQVVRWNGVAGTLAVDAPAATTVTLNVLAYPGWRVRVDGAPLATAAAPPHGWLTFDVPAGAHTVTLRFAETPVRLAADVVSGLALLAAVWLLASRRPATQPADPGGPPVTTRQAGALALAALLLAGLAPRLGVDRLRADGTVTGVPPAAVAYADGLRLVGVDSGRATAAADTPLEVALYWTTDRPPARRYRATVTLLDDAGQLWSAKQSEPPRRFRQPFQTTDWLPGRYAEDWHVVVPLPGTPPGTYRLALTLFDRDTLANVPPAGSVAATVPLGTVTVLRSADSAEFQPQFPLPPQPGRALQALGFDADRAQARPGDPFLLTLFWEAAAPLDAAVADAAWTARYELVDASGAVVVAEPRALLGGKLAPADWRAGDRWRDPQLFRLPAALTGGPYRWRVVLCADDPACAAAPIALSTVTVDAPQRRSDLPPAALALDARLGDVARLRGATVTAADGRLAVELVWQAQRTPAIGYRVFVHLLDADGQIVAQADGEPDGGRYPTTAWLPGDVVVDRHTLPAPPDLTTGSYTLIAGLYDPAGGARPLLPDGTSFVVLQKWPAQP